jgi:hypothetical protein
VVPCFACADFLNFLAGISLQYYWYCTVYFMNIWMHGPSVISSARSVWHRALRVPTFFNFLAVGSLQYY